MNFEQFHILLMTKFSLCSAEHALTGEAKASVRRAINKIGEDLKACPQYYKYMEKIALVG